MNIDIQTVWATIATVASIAFAWLYKNRLPLAKCLYKIVEAYEDEKISDEELKEIIEECSKLIK